MILVYKLSDLDIFRLFLSYVYKCGSQTEIPLGIFKYQINL